MAVRGANISLGRLGILLLPFLLLQGVVWGQEPPIQEQLQAIQKQLREIHQMLEEIQRSLPRRSVPPPPREVVVPLDDDPVLGDPQAPVVLVEFSDFQCPFCGRFYKQTLPLLRKQYIETGKVRMVYRDFPLSFHPEAFPAALAAHCAREQGKFWEMHDRLLERQQELGPALYRTLAQELGLDVAAFDRCMAEERYMEEIRRDQAEGRRLGVRGTPSFFLGISQDGKSIRSRILVGAKPFSVFQARIEALLRQVANRPQRPSD